MAGPHPDSRGAQLLEEWRGDLSQEKACELLGLDEASYSRFKTGKRKPSAAVIFRIERLTDGKVYAKSWYEPPQRIEKAS